MSFHGIETSTQGHSIYVTLIKIYLFFFSETLKRQNAAHEPGLSFVIKDITSTTGKIN